MGLYLYSHGEYIAIGKVGVILFFAWFVMLFLDILQDNKRRRNEDGLAVGRKTKERQKEKEIKK